MLISRSLHLTSCHSWVRPHDAERLCQRLYQHSRQGQGEKTRAPSERDTHCEVRGVLTYLYAGWSHVGQECGGPTVEGDRNGSNSVRGQQEGEGQTWLEEWLLEKENSVLRWDLTERKWCIGYQHWCLGGGQPGTRVQGSRVRSEWRRHSIWS